VIRIYHDSALVCIFTVASFSFSFFNMLLYTILFFFLISTDLYYPFVCVCVCFSLYIFSHTCAAVLYVYACECLFDHLARKQHHSYVIRIIYTCTCITFFFVLKVFFFFSIIFFYFSSLSFFAVFFLYLSLSFQHITTEEKSAAKIMNETKIYIYTYITY
jgi:hypothetical protein